MISFLFFNLKWFCVGKSVTTSVPSISIKFHANAEQIEEFYASEEENNVGNDKADKVVTIPTSSPLNIGK